MTEPSLQRLYQTYPGLTQTILDYIAHAPTWDLYHINPYRLAEGLGLGEEELLDWLLLAVHEGAFDLIWNSLCPLCGANEHQHGSLNHLETDFFCIPCNTKLTGELDDRVEVVFQPREVLRKLNFSPHGAPEDYGKFYFSANYIRPQGMIELLPRLKKGFWLVHPGQRIEVDLQVEAPQYRLVSMDLHDQAFFDQTAGGQSQAEVAFEQTGFAKKQFNLAPGLAKLTIHNRGTATAGLTLQQTAFEQVQGIFQDTPPRFHRFLTGKEILNRQVFRELFPIQDLPADLNLRVGEVTLLFTDLKGSTALYEEAGDIDAYRLVRDHFAILTQAVRRHRGAIVKTIGDAVMAAFSRPTDGLEAALEMLRELSSYSRKSPREVGLKVGLHKGPALAVNANQSLDYFGRTVNIAARVQGQADAGEVWLSDSIYSSAGMAKLLEQAGYGVESRLASLRGIAEPVSLYRASARL